MTGTTERRHPVTVVAATALMATAGLGYIAFAVALFGQAGHARAWTREALPAAGSSLTGMEGFSSGATVLVAVGTLVAGLTLLGAAAAVRSGSQAGRITAWVVMGLIVLCGAGGATRAGTPDFGNNVTLTAWESDGSTRVLRMSATLPDAYSPAYRIASGVFATAAILALLIAIVLLTRPSAGRWFRPEAGRPVPPPVLYRPGGPFAPPPVPPPAPDGPFAPPPPGPASPLAPPLGAEPGPAPIAPGLANPYAGPAAVPRQRPPSGAGPSWSRPVEGPGSASQSRAERKAQLAVLTRRHQRGELTDAEYTALRARLAAD